jgi:hypothetical protein
MRILSNTRAFGSGLLVSATVFFPALLFGQAGPGPITPPESVYTDPGPAPAPVPKPRGSQGKPTIVGTWRLNRDESDDARKKLQEAQQSGGGGNGGRGGGVHVGGYPGGYPGGGYPGGGYPGGGGGGYGGHRNSYSNDDLNRLSDVLNPARNVTVTKSDSAVEVSDDLDRKREFYTDGRKLEKSKNAKGDSYREASAQWDDTRLITQEEGPKGGKIERVLSPYDGENGPQLTETFKILDSHGNTTGVVRLVFDRIEQPAESSKQ